MCRLMAQMPACCLHGVDAVCKQSRGGEEDDMGLFSELCRASCVFSLVELPQVW